MKTGNVITLKKQKAIDILRKRKNTSDALAEIKKKRLPVPSIEEWRQDRLDFLNKEGSVEPAGLKRWRPRPTPTPQTQMTEEKRINFGLKKLQLLLAGNQSFNPYIDIQNKDKVILHLAEEIGEFLNAYRKQDRVKMKMEIGDIQIMLAFACASVHFDLEECLIYKLKYNIMTGRFKPEKPLEEYF